MPLGVRYRRGNGRRRTLLFTKRAPQPEALPVSTTAAQDLVYLCPTCRAADLPGLFTWRHEEPSWEFVHVLSESRCEFCRLLCRLVMDDHGMAEAYAFVDKKAILRLKRCSLWEYKFRGGVVGGVAGRRAAIFFPGTERENMADCRHDDPEDGVCILPLSRGNPTFGLSPRKTLADVALVRNWLRTCDQSHGDECWQAPKQKEVPQFVIDVKNTCIVPNPGGAGFKYLALSYVWGKVKQPTLVKKTLRAWQKKEALLKLGLPQTIQDAMTLTADLGERYLWVDSLCMLQDDLENFRYQIEQMHTVYRQAYLTIIAAFGQDSNAGLPGVRNSPSQRQVQVIADVGPVQLSTLPIKAHGEMRKSTWNSRGWTFQEELCSSRRLVFTQSTITFNCMAATWREDFPERLIVNSRERYSYLYNAFGSTQSNIEHENEDILQWYSIVLQNYLSRNLTNANDILKGFAGVTSLVSHVLGNTFWGLPKKYFHEAICWNTIGHAPSKGRRGFPSWSWCGYHHSKYRADKVLFELLPRHNGLRPRRIVQFVNLSNPSEIWSRIFTHSHAHFKADLNGIMQRYSHVSQRDRQLGYLIGFFSSSARLLVESAGEKPAGETQLVFIRAPQTGQLLCTMLADSQLVFQPPVLRDFVVIGQVPHRAALYDPLNLASEFSDSPGQVIPEDRELFNQVIDARRHATLEDSFVLLMIERQGEIALRQGITSAVPQSLWWATENQREAIILG